MTSYYVSNTQSVGNNDVQRAGNLEQSLRGRIPFNSLATMKWADSSGDRISIVVNESGLTGAMLVAIF